MLILIIIYIPIYLQFMFSCTDCHFPNSTYTFKFAPTSFHSALSPAIIYSSDSQDMSLIYPHNEYPAQIKMAVIFTDFFPEYLEKRLCQHPAIDDNDSQKLLISPFLAEITEVPAGWLSAMFIGN